MMYESKGLYTSVHIHIIYGYKRKVNETSRHVRFKNRHHFFYFWFYFMFNFNQRRFYLKMEKAINIKYKGIYDLRVYELEFKGSYYKVTFYKYSDCLNIKEILYICDLKDKNNTEKYFNKVLRDYETEYKQIETLLKAEFNFK